MTRDFKKLAHSIYECKYHVVFCPKYRLRILKGDLGAYVAEKIQKLSKQKDSVEIFELNVRPDHVHLVASIAPKYAVSKMMGFLKGKVAISVFQHYPHIGKQYWGRHMWSRGYCVSTVGLAEERIRKYVQWQEKKEKQQEAIQGRLCE